MIDIDLQYDIIGYINKEEKEMISYCNWKEVGFDPLSSYVDYKRECDNKEMTVRDLKKQKSGLQCGNCKKLITVK